MCFDGYITIDSSEPSKSGLYVVDLPGITLNHLHSLTKEDQDDYQAFFENIYKNAQINLLRDLQAKLGDRFHYDQKLVSRETSAFLASNNDGSGLAGVKLSMNMPKYARLTIVSIGFYSTQIALSPQFKIYVYDTDENGELLATVSTDAAVGRNTVQLEEVFETDDLFIAFDSADLVVRKTENKYYSDWTYSKDKLACTFPCWFGDPGSVQQVNGGGLNVKFIVTCSMDKFVCDNLPIFKYALWNRIGVELVKEYKVSDRVNRFTVLSPDRADELMAVYQEDYNKALDAATKTIKITEDPVCFLCKSVVSARTDLP